MKRPSCEGKGAKDATGGRKAELKEPRASAIWPVGFTPEGQETLSLSE